MTRLVVAIDGPAGAGKSSVARRLAEALGYRYVDSGAMYRVIGVLAAAAGIDLTDGAALGALCDRTHMDFDEEDGRIRVFANGRDLSAAIRTADAGQFASRVSAVPAVREHLVAKQRAMAAGGSVVMEGRDIGTVVCPDAAVKVFLDASPHERARRRAHELHGVPSAVEVDRMAREIAERDARDRTRVHSPLRPAADAVVVDTTTRRIDDVVEELRALVAERAAALASQS
jgi:cytidylate kinase